jgi:crossover junction endodeoxyribonuclease RuvC
MIIGIDLGVSGALAILEGGELVEVHDMPCLSDGPARRRSINAPLLAEIIAKSHATSAFIEYVGPRPREGAVGAFAFGRAKGASWPTTGFLSRS